MKYFVLLFAFVTVFVQGGGVNLCGPGGRCPPHHECVAGTGCVRTNIACQQPETPCVFPQVSDCKGGCTFKNCTLRKSCLKLVNPADRCEKATCQDGICVAERLTCAGCNPTTGCPSRRASSSVTTSAGTRIEEDGEEGKGVGKKWGDHDDDDDDHPHTENTWNAGVIASVFFLIFISLLIFGALAYLGTTASRVGY